MKFRLILLTAVIASLSLSSFGQKRGGKRDFANMPKIGIVEGKIIDKTSKSPLEFVSVALYKQKDSTVVTGVITDKNGNFSIKQVPFGKFYVCISSIGYSKRYQNSIKITPRKTSHKMNTIQLEQSSIGLEGIEVVGEKNRVQYKLDKKIINVSSDLTSANKTAVEVLENTPSVEVDMDGEVSLRGSSNFTVLINGRPSVLQGSEALEQIPASSIKNIELITNPSAKHDPSGIAGIINIVMKKEKSPGVTGLVTSDVSSDGSYKGNISLNLIKTKYSIFSTLSYQDRNHNGSMENDRASIISKDTIIETTSETTSGDRNRGRKGYSFKLGTDITITERDFMSLSGNIGLSNRSGEKLNELRSNSSLKDFTIYEINEKRSDDESNYYTLNADYTHKFNKVGHQLDFSSTFSSKIGEDEKNTNYFVTDKEYNTKSAQQLERDEFENEKSRDLRVKLDYTNPISTDSKLELGVHLNTEFENENILTKDKINNIWTEIPQYTNDFDFKRNIYSAYSTYSNKLGSVDFMLGLRLEKTDREYKNNFTGKKDGIDKLDYFPTAHISHKIDKSNQVSASYGRRIRRPSGRSLDPFTKQMDSKNIKVGNPNLEPEYTNSYELSYQYKFGYSFIAIESFYRNTSNLITRVITMNEDRIMLHSFENQNEDHSLGMELMLNLKLSKKIMLNTSFNTFYYELNGAVNGNEVVKSTTTYGGRLNASYSLRKATKFQIQGFFRGPSVTINGNRDAMGGINFAVKQSFMKGRLATTFQVRDVFETFKFSFDSDMTTKGETTGEVIQTNSKYTFRRDSPIFSISASYRLNNFKEKRKKRNSGESRDMDIDY